MWGTRWRQRLRLGPLYLALRAADAMPSSERSWSERSPAEQPSWRRGLSIVIPDRDAPEMLAEALASVDAALEAVDEPRQIVVVANGAPEARYASVRASFPHVEVVHSAE